MPFQKHALLISTIVLLTGCVGRQAFFVSPFNGVNNQYHTIPAKKDSLPAAFYANVAFTGGSANDNAGDKVFAAYTSVSRSVNFGRFQGFYGIGLGAGSYTVDTYDQGANTTVNPVAINARAGKKSFSGYGFDGGINYTVTGEKNEWRAMGMELSFRSESGDYYSFRKTLPPGSATLNIQSKNYWTAGVTTELIHFARGFDYGLKLGLGRVLNRAYHKGKIIDSYFYQHNVLYNYLNIDFHITKEKWTGYLQYNDACKASMFMIGANYRISRR